MAAGTTVFAVFIVLLGFTYQFFVQPIVYHRLGVMRPLEYVNNERCERVTELEACEDGWLHQTSGKLYLACSTVSNKYDWLPNAQSLTRAPEDEYVAILDTKADGPYASRITKVTPKGFAGHDGKGSLLLHGMGVFYGSDGLGSDETMRLFLINHRPQADAATLGANSTVELFETTLGSDSMTHVRTYAHPTLFTPNNLVPTGPDSFYFSNDHSVKVGHSKQLDLLLPRSSIGHCDELECKLVEEKVAYPNGLAGAKNYPSREPNVLYKASTSEEYVTVYDIQADKSLTVKDRVRIGYPMDNINMADDGSLVVSAFPKLLAMAHVLTTRGTTNVAPSVTLRIAKNKGKDAFYGHKYKVDKIFEDDGHVASAMTNSLLDTERNLLFLGGIVTPYISICQLPTAV